MNIRNNSCHSAKTSEWATPQEFYDRLNSEFGFTLDAASTHENAKCAKHYTAKEDGLTHSWAGEIVWLNPPYTSGPRCAKVIRAWVEKAYTESQRGALVVCLVPARTDSWWWHEYAVKGEVRFVRGRLKFQESSGVAIRRVTPSVAEGRHAPNKCAPFASAVVIFRPKSSKSSAGKIAPKQRDEVNRLMEECQDDLEAVLFRLVGQRECLREAINDIHAVATGEEQVADDDTEGMQWIVERIEATMQSGKVGDAAP